MSDLAGTPNCCFAHAEFQVNLCPGLEYLRGTRSLIGPQSTFFFSHVGTKVLTSIMGSLVSC